MSEGTGLFLAALALAARGHKLQPGRASRAARAVVRRTISRACAWCGSATAAAAAVGVALIASVPSVTAPIHVDAGGRLVVPGQHPSPGSGAGSRAPTPLVGAEVLGTDKSPHGPQDHAGSISPDPINAESDAPEHLNCIALMTKSRLGPLRPRRHLRLNSDRSHRRLTRDAMAAGAGGCLAIAALAHRDDDPPSLPVSRGRSLDFERYSGVLDLELERYSGCAGTASIARADNCAGVLQAGRSERRSDKRSGGRSDARLRL